MHEAEDSYEYYDPLQAYEEHFSLHEQIIKTAPKRALELYYMRREGVDPSIIAKLDADLADDLDFVGIKSFEFFKNMGGGW